MLREEQNSDIPGRTTMRACINKLLDGHLDQLEEAMQVHFPCDTDKMTSMQQKSIGKISFTMDIWTDTNLSPFMAVTAYWIEATMEDTSNGLQKILKLQVDLVGFHHMPGRHDGKHLVHAFILITDRLDIMEKVYNSNSFLHFRYLTDYALKIRWITLDNTSNNNTFMTTLERELKH
jgi:hypothetical protein